MGFKLLVKVVFGGFAKGIEIRILQIESQAKCLGEMVLSLCVIGNLML